MLRKAVEKYKQINIMKKFIFELRLGRDFFYYE